MEASKNATVISRRNLATLAWTVATVGILCGIYFMSTDQIPQALVVYLTSFALAAILASIADRQHTPPPYDVQLLRQQRAGMIMLVVGGFSAVVGAPLALTAPGFLSQFMLAIAPGTLIVGWLTYRRARARRLHGPEESPQA